MKALEILSLQNTLDKLDKTGYKDRWNNADQTLQCKNKHTKTVEMVGNDGISLYNGNSFRRSWQQEQKQKQQNYVIP